MNPGTTDTLGLLVAIAQLVTPVFVAGIGWLLKRTIGDIDRRLAANERFVEAMQTEAARLERTKAQAADLARLAESAVTKEDWIRETTTSRKRMELVLGEMQELKGQNRAGVEIGAAVAAALNARDQHGRQ